MYKEEGVPRLWALFISRGSFIAYIELTNFLKLVKKIEEDIYELLF